MPTAAPPDSTGRILGSLVLVLACGHEVTIPYAGPAQRPVPHETVYCYTCMSQVEIERHVVVLNEEVTR